VKRMRPGLIFVSLLLPVLGASEALAATDAPEDECMSTLQVRETASVEADVDGPVSDTYPDFTTGFDTEGPYLEEPDEEEADSPRPVMAGWENSTSLEQQDSWVKFCDAHKVGYFCSGSTRVRCCQGSGGFVKCGTTALSSSCGAELNQIFGRRRRSFGGGGGFGGGFGGGGGGFGGGGGGFDRRRPYHIHRGWSPSPYCQSHHTGYFCQSHHRVHCCNDFGHFVECTTRIERRTHC